MELKFVRHALPTRVDGSDRGQVADPGLQPDGWVQARALADFLVAEPIDAIYVSGARRAQETAKPLAEATGLTPNLMSELAEWDAASPSYVPIEELKAAGDPRWEIMRKGDLYDPDFDMATYRAGVVSGVERVVSRHPGGAAVLVTHAGVINAYAGHVLDQPKALWMALTRSPGYASISRIAAARDGWRSIISLNETGHVRHLVP